MDLARRHRLLQHDHPTGHPAQRPREPGVVHGVHAVPTRDQPGPSGGAAQLPDDGQRPDRARGGERLPPRRGDRGGRGDDDVPPARSGRGRDLPRRRRLPPPDDRGARDAGPTARPDGRHRRPGGEPRRAGRLRRARAVPGHRRRGARPGRDLRPGALRRGAGRRRGRPAGTDAHHRARRARRRHRRRQLAALRRAAVVRGPARGLHRDPRLARALAAGAPRRGLRGRGGSPGPAAGAPDP